jgi:hypothetical protein
MSDTFIFAAQVPLSREAFKAWLAASPTLERAPDLDQVFRGRWEAEAPAHDPFGDSVLELIKQRLLPGGPLLVHQRGVLSIYATENGFYRNWFGNWLALLATVAPLTADTGLAVFAAETGGHLYPKGVLSLLQVDRGAVHCLPGSVNAALRSLRGVEKRYFTNLESGSVPIDELILPRAKTILSVGEALDQIASLAAVKWRSTTSAAMLTRARPAIDALAKTATKDSVLPALAALLQHESPAVAFAAAWTLVRLASRSKAPAALDAVADYLEPMPKVEYDRIDGFFDDPSMERLGHRACDAFAKNPTWREQRLDRSLLAKRHPYFLIGSMTPEGEEVQRLAVRVAASAESFDGWFNYAHLLQLLGPLGAEQVGPQAADRLREGRLSLLLANVDPSRLEVDIRSGDDPVWCPLNDRTPKVICSTNPLTEICNSVAKIQQPSRFAEPIRSLFAHVVAVIQPKPVLYFWHIYGKEQPRYISFLTAPPPGLEDALAPVRLKFDAIFSADERARALVDELTAYRTTDEAAAKDAVRHLRNALECEGREDYLVEQCLETGAPPPTLMLEFLLSSYILDGDADTHEVSATLKALRSRREPHTEALLPQLLGSAQMIGPEDAYRLCLEGALLCQSLGPPSKMHLIQLLEAFLLRWPTDERLLSTYFMVCATVAESSRALPWLLRNAAVVGHTNHHLTRLWAAKVLDDTRCAEAVFDADTLADLVACHRPREP